MTRGGLVAAALLCFASCGGATEGESTGAAASAGTGGQTAGTGGIASGGVSATGAFGGGPVEPALCGGVPCVATDSCCIATATCFAPDLDPDACPRPPADTVLEGQTPCSSNAHCAPNEYCVPKNDRLCYGSGACQSRDNCASCSGDPGVCTVCGCDGETYPDVQTACAAGVRVMSMSRSACGQTVDFGGGSAGVGNVAPLRLTPCALDEQCPTGERCCFLTGVCYDATIPDLCREPPEGTSFPCVSDAQCFPGSEYCAGPGCDGPGGCAARNGSDCGVKFEPVCGCDGATYTSAACAAQSGVRVASVGTCP